MAGVLCRYMMNTLGGVSIASSVDWNRSATPKNNGPLMAKISTPSGTVSSSGRGMSCAAASSSSPETQVWMPVSSLMRRMNSREASMTPVYTATVRSKITVSAKVRIITDQSDFGPWKICRTVRRSLMS